MATEFKIDAAKVGVAIVVVVGAFLAFQVWGRVTSLETRVVELNVAVEQLSDVQDEIAAVDAKLAQTAADVAEVAQARDDILTELCAILERPPSACGVSP